jgi:hypothetical protein
LSEVLKQKPHDRGRNLHIGDETVLRVQGPTGFHDVSGPELVNGAVASINEEPSVAQQNPVLRLDRANSVVHAWRIVEVAYSNQLQQWPCPDVEGPWPIVLIEVSL